MKRIFMYGIIGKKVFDDSGLDITAVAHSKIVIPIMKLRIPYAIGDIYSILIILFIVGVVLQILHAKFNIFPKFILFKIIKVMIILFLASGIMFGFGLTYQALYGWKCGFISQYNKFLYDAGPIIALGVVVALLDRSWDSGSSSSQPTEEYGFKKNKNAGDIDLLLGGFNFDPNEWPSGIEHGTEVRYVYNHKLVKDKYNDRYYDKDSGLEYIPKPGTDIYMKV